MVVIISNAISKDSYSRRYSRLSSASANVTALAAELGLNEERVAEIMAMAEDWTAARALTQTERGEKDMAFENYRFKQEDISQHYLRVKEFLTAVIEGSEQGRELAEAYGIARRAPQNYEEMTSKVRTLLDKHEELVAAGDERVAPQGAIDLLRDKNTELIRAFQKISTEKQESAAAYDSLQALYERHSNLLRYLYELATLVWGKYDPKLMLLGFAPSKPHPRGGQPDVLEEFVVVSEDPEIRFSWRKSENATSYQLVYSVDKDIWEDLYSGEEAGYSYIPPAGKRWYQVRARNANGYSDWSDMLMFEAPEVPV